MTMKQHYLAIAGTLAFLLGGTALAQSSGKAAAMTEADVTTRLQAAGYTGIHDVEREGKHFDAEATTKDGKPVHLHIDVRTGAITRVAAESEEEEEHEEHEHDEGEHR
jgi:hypothetical protein